MQTIPFNNITSLGQKTMLDNPLFNVSWILGRFCNYKCTYCWPYANTDKPDHQELSLYKHTIDEIKRQARDNNYTQFHFSFSGGEPTAYKNFGELIEYYCSDTAPEYQSLHMTTNLSPGSKWWNKWLETTKDLQRRSITASFHAEFANEQEFGDKCLQLMKEGVLVTINQVMVPELWKEYYERSLRFIDRGIHVTLKPQSDPTASFVVSGYTEEQTKILQTESEQDTPQVRLKDAQGVTYELDQAERLNAFGFNKFKGWNCNAGYQSCIIRGDEVKRAYSCSDEPLGTLKDGFTLFKTPSKCVTDTCVSSADNKIPKEIQ
jgi:organic radical activating enzyme|tara:strand:- start:5056 stop:6015 length:960 start_codon:yes stop_codon:yes gene_type:complete